MLAVPAVAHDANSWGGLFRSRDDGQAWLSADAGLFIGGSLAVAVSPTDAGHLLYGTDTRLLRSRNGGRNWVTEAPQLFQGPALAVAFSPDEDCAWAATPAGVFAACGNSGWQRSDAPEDAVPGRALAGGSRPERVYLLGSRGVYASSDRGRKFHRIGTSDLPDAPGRALLLMPGPAEALFAIFDGRVWASFDEGSSWAPRDGGLPLGRMEALASDQERPGRLWAASGNRVHVSDDRGATWQTRGGPISEGDLTIRGLATAQDGTIIVLSTHKGLMRSHDGGNAWAQVEGALPVHLEAGPLLRDPHDAQTLYVGFSLVPYVEQRRRAEQGSSLLSRLDPVSIAGAAAFLLLLFVGGWSGARRLAYAYRNA